MIFSKPTVAYARDSSRLEVREEMQTCQYQPWSGLLNALRIDRSIAADATPESK
jgi:hypothetical protein